MGGRENLGRSEREEKNGLWMIFENQLEMGEKVGRRPQGKGKHILSLKVNYLSKQSFPSATALTPTLFLSLPLSLKYSCLLACLYPLHNMQLQTLLASEILLPHQLSLSLCLGVPSLKATPFFTIFEIHLIIQNVFFDYCVSTTFAHYLFL